MGWAAPPSHAEAAREAACCALHWCLAPTASDTVHCKLLGQHLSLSQSACSCLESGLAAAQGIDGLHVATLSVTDARSVLPRTGRSSQRSIAVGAALGAQTPCSHSPPAGASTSSGKTATPALQAGTMCPAAPWAGGPALPWPAACAAAALAVGPCGPCARLGEGVPRCCTLQMTMPSQQLPGQLRIVEPAGYAQRRTAGCTSFAFVPCMILGHGHRLALLQCTEAGDRGSRCWQPLGRAADCCQPTGHALHKPDLRCYASVQECAARTDMREAWLPAGTALMLRRSQLAVGQPCRRQW